MDHPSRQKKCSPIHKRDSMSVSTCEVVQRPYYVLFRATFRTGLHSKSTVLVRRNYDRTTIAVWERLFVSYCITYSSPLSLYLTSEGERPRVTDELTDARIQGITQRHRKEVSVWR